MPAAGASCPVLVPVPVRRVLPSPAGRAGSRGSWHGVSSGMGQGAAGGCAAAPLLFGAGGWGLEQEAEDIFLPSTLRACVCVTEIREPALPSSPVLLKGCHVCWTFPICEFPPWSSEQEVEWAVQPLREGFGGP